MTYFLDKVKEYLMSNSKISRNLLVGLNLLKIGSNIEINFIWDHKNFDKATNFHQLYEKIYNLEEFQLVKNLLQE